MVEVLVRELFPRALVVTPNLDEAAHLVGRPLAGEPDMEIRIVNEMVLWNQKTLRIAQSTCPWIFRGAECGYGGSASWCDQSYERCTALGNADRFGGFEFLPSIMERQVWWGRIPK